MILFASAMNVAARLLAVPVAFYIAAKFMDSDLWMDIMQARQDMLNKAMK